MDMDRRRKVKGENNIIGQRRGFRRIGVEN